jgi:hypothetical protein
MEQVFGNLNDPLTWPVLPYVILLDIFAAFFNCTLPLDASNLQHSYLILDVNSNDGGASLSNLTIQHLSKPWWHTVSWSTAFPFSSSGRWAQAGGDLDSTFTPIAAEPQGDGTIRFDVTPYFKSLLSDQTIPHYGFVMRAEAATTRVTLDSVQFSTVSKRPRLESTYTCTAPTSHALQIKSAAERPLPFTYVLGTAR